MIVVFLLQILDNVNREINLNITGLNAFKNVLLILICGLFINEIYVLHKDDKDIIFFDEMKSILKLAFVFAILSIYFIFKNRHFDIITIEGIFRVIFPIVVAFSILNVMTLDDIYKFMIIIFIISFAGYLWTIGLNNITFENFSAMSLVHSYSPFESNFFSPVAMSFCLFFCYYRKNKLFLILSVLFTIMTFKRIMVVYSLFLLLFGWAFQKNYRIPSGFILLYKIGFFILSIFYINLMLGNVEDIINKYLGMNVNTFSMGRSWLMKNIYYNYESYGFMTSTVDFRGMEMDIPQFYVEMGICSVIAAIHYIANLARVNWYNFLMIVFCMLELLTSHWIDIVYFWMIMYITIGCIAYKDNEKFIKKSKFKLVIKNKKVL